MKSFLSTLFAGLLLVATPAEALFFTLNDSSEQRSHEQIIESCTETNRALQARCLRMQTRLNTTISRGRRYGGTINYDRYNKILERRKKSETYRVGVRNTEVRQRSRNINSELKRRNTARSHCDSQFVTETKVNNRFGAVKASARARSRCLDNAANSQRNNQYLRTFNRSYRANEANN